CVLLRVHDNADAVDAPFHSRAGTGANGPAALLRLQRLQQWQVRFRNFYHDLELVEQGDLEEDHGAVPDHLAAADVALEDGAVTRRADLEPADLLFLDGVAHALAADDPPDFLLDRLDLLVGHLPDLQRPLGAIGGGEAGRQGPPRLPQDGLGAAAGAVR